MQALWPWGRIEIVPLDDTGQYSELAEYLIKETEKTFRAGSPSKKRWEASKGLIHPKPKAEVVDADKWHQKPRAWDGYYVEKASVGNYQNKDTGAESQFYRMIKLPDDMMARRMLVLHGEISEEEAKAPIKPCKRPAARTKPFTAGRKKNENRRC